MLAKSWSIRHCSPTPKYWKNTADVKLSLREAEKQFCGYDHAMIGGELLKSWNLPRSVVAAVMFHHEPAIDTESNLSCLIHLADICCHNLGESYGGYAAQIPVDLEAFNRLEIAPIAIEEAMVKVQSRLRL